MAELRKETSFLLRKHFFFILFIPSVQGSTRGAKWTTGHGSTSVEDLPGEMGRA